jgi:hypothetical protein
MSLPSVNGMYPTIDLQKLWELAAKKDPAMPLENYILDDAALTKVNTLKKLAGRLCTATGVSITVVNTRASTIPDVETRKVRIRKCLALLADGIEAATSFTTFTLNEEEEEEQRKRARTEDDPAMVTTSATTSSDKTAASTLTATTPTSTANANATTSLAASTPATTVAANMLTTASTSTATTSTANANTTTSLAAPTPATMGSGPGGQGDMSQAQLEELLQFHLERGWSIPDWLTPSPVTPARAQQQQHQHCAITTGMPQQQQAPISQQQVPSFQQQQQAAGTTAAGSFQQQHGTSPQMYTTPYGATVPAAYLHRPPTAGSNAYVQQFGMTSQLLQQDLMTGSGMALGQDGLDGRALTQLQNRNRGILNTTGALTVHGFGNASDVCSMDRPLRPAYHKLVEQYVIDWDFAAYLAGKKPTQDVVIMGFQFQQQPETRHPTNEAVFDLVSKELQTSMEMCFPGAGMRYGRLRARVKMRLRQYNDAGLVFKFERHCRAQATLFFRETGLLSSFDPDPESESAFFGGLRAALCMICKGPHATVEHDAEIRRGNGSGNGNGNGNSNGNSNSNGNGNGGRNNGGRSNGGGAGEAGRGNSGNACRDYLRGACARGAKCRYEHPPGKEGSKGTNGGGPGKNTNTATPGARGVRG